MIWRPKKGQAVQIRYRKSMRETTVWHGFYGIVKKAGTGPGPINALVYIPAGASGYYVVVPRGNLLRA